jgi:hypothetical protein
MNYLITIESTEKCPFGLKGGRSGIEPQCRKKKNTLAHYPCVGLGNSGCPMCEKSCDSCKYKNHCRGVVMINIKPVDGITFCSAYEPEAK